MPWPCAILELQRGRLDLLPAAANTRERESFALFSRPTNSARNILFIATDAEARYRLDTLTDIIRTDFRLAVQRGSTYGDSYDPDHIAFSKANNDTTFVKRFDEALGAMMADGTYKRILKQYLHCPIRMERLGCQ